MELKDLLVYVDDSKSCPARLDAAIRIAQTHGAHLTGLYVLPPLNISPYAEVRIPGQILAEQREAARARAAEAKSAFKVASDKAGLSSEWRFVEDEPVRTVVSHSRYVDLVIVGQTAEMDPPSIGSTLAEDLVLAAGRPVLVIPDTGVPDSIGQRVLIAWNASREAVRAVNDALPLLERAQTVDLLAINPPGKYIAGEGETPSSDICQHLARHGVNVEAAHIEAQDISVGDMLLSRAADRRVDLIVMGAYGHSRLREFVLGGATRHLLQHMTVPVLMAH